MKALTKFTLPALVLALVTALPTLAQGPNPFPPGLAKELAARASKYTEVTLDKNMLGFASQFMNKDDQSDQQAKHLVSSLNAIYVRTYDFDKPGQYSMADIQRIRREFRGPEWQPVVQSVTHSKGVVKVSMIYRKVVNGETQGMLILDAKPEKLSFVYISGNLNPSDLSVLGGNFGIPQGQPQPDPQLHTRPNSDRDSSHSAGGNQ